jgi:hypothetical protein
MGISAYQCQPWEEHHIYYQPYRARMEPPAEHLRGLETDQPQLENVAGNVWANAVEPYPGMVERWGELAGTQDPKEAFLAAYTAYVREAGRLYRDKPEQYGFLKESLFEGRQYVDVWEAIQARRCADVIFDMPELVPETWKHLDEGRRIELLGEIERRLAEVQGRPALDVVGVAMEPPQDESEGGGPPVRSFGVCSLREGKLYINTDPRCLDNLQEAVVTVVHEGRHAYQGHSVLHPGVHHDPLDVAEWTTNLFHPMPAEEYGYEIYRAQPAEADAFAFEQAVRNELFGKAGR